MKKLILSTIIILLPLLAGAEIFYGYGEAFNTQLYYSFDTETHKCTVLPRPDQAPYTMGTIEIPAYEVHGDRAFPVTAIGATAFNMCPATSITLPAGLESIGSGAFHECTNLASIELPATLVSIGDYAFQYCSSLTSVVLPDNLTTLGKNAFAHCDALTSVTIPGSVKAISEKAFAECPELTSLTLKEGVETIEKQAFYHAKYFANLKIPNSVKTIGEEAFANPRTIEPYTRHYVTFGTGLTTIGKGAFDGTYYDDLNIPDNVTSIGDNAFANCFLNNNYRTVVLGKKVTSLGHNVFKDGRVRDITVKNRELANNICDDTFTFYSVGHAHVPADFLIVYQNSLWQSFFPHIVGDGPEMEYPLWVGGTQVKTANRQSLPASAGTISFDPINNVLTLTNATLTTDEQGSYCISNGDPWQYYAQGISGLTITIKGTCCLTANDVAIVVNDNTTINGDGKLILDSKDQGIWVGQNKQLTINVHQFQASTTKEAVFAAGGSSKLTLSGITFECTQKSPGTFSPISGFSSLTLTNVRYSDPGGAWKYADTSKYGYDTSARYITFDNQKHTSNLLIEHKSEPRKYRLWIAGTQMNSVNIQEENLPGIEGLVMFSPNSNKLFLEGATINATQQGDYCISNGDPDLNLEGIPGLTIQLTGTCKLNSLDRTMVINGNTTITGDQYSRLELKSNYEEAILVGQHSQLTFNIGQLWANAPNPVIKGIGGTSKVVVDCLESFECVPKSSSSSSTISGAGSFTISNNCRWGDPGGAWVNALPESYRYDIVGRQLLVDETPYKGKVLIESTSQPIKYRLWVGRARVTSENMGSIHSDEPMVTRGTVAFDPTTNVLTLNNINYVSSKEGIYGVGNGDATIGLEGIPGLKVELLQNNTIKTYDAGLMIAGNTTFTGDGKLSVTTTDMYPAYIGSNSTLTFKDTDVTLSGIGGVRGVDKNRNTGFTVNHSRVDIKPNDRTAVSGLSEFSMIACQFADPGDLNWVVYPEDYEFDDYYGILLYRQDEVMWHTLIEPTETPTEITLTPSSKDEDSDCWYTLDGRKLDVVPTAKGVYVKNNRKVVIK